jgi:hypothetical protein
LNQAEWIAAVAAAGATDLNQELTIILESLNRAIEETPAYAPHLQLLYAARKAAQRCAFTASALLNFSARRGAGPTVGNMENLFNGC